MQAPTPDDVSGAPAPPPRRRQPWWIPPFLGRVPDDVTPAQVSLLGVIALALVFEHYDLSMLGSAARHIRESFGLPQSELGRLTGFVRLGALPAVLLVPFADRIGRRRLFLACIVGTSLATVLTAFTQNATQFILVQMVLRTFLIAGSAVAFVIVAEEIPAEHRGWAIGILGALGSVGFGLGAAVFSLVDVLPYGWRALYFFGVVPLALLPMFHRRVTETRRFHEHRRTLDAEGGGSLLRPFVDLAVRYPWRTAAITAIGLFAAAGHGAAHQLLGDYVLTDHGWSPGRYSLMFVLGGALGIVGNTLAGRWADRYGRRAVGFGVLFAFPFVAWGFYHVPGGWLPVLWIPMVFVTTGGNTIVRALATELFPTAARGTATGTLSMFETLGAAGALFLVSALTLPGDSNADAVGFVVFLTAVAALIALRLPETARRELEDISGEAEPAPR